MADEKIPQNQHDDPDKDWNTEGMRGMAPPGGGLLANQGDGRGLTGNDGGIPLKPGWNRGYFYAEGEGGTLVLVPGECVEMLCGSNGLKADKASLLLAFAERGLNPPKEVYLAYPSDPLHNFFRQYAELTDGGRDGHFAQFMQMSRQIKEENMAASMPQPLADGNAAHLEIAKKYRRHQGQGDPDIFTNSTSTGKILEQIERNGYPVDPTALSESEKRARPDIAHARLLHLYEIKPFNLYAEGIAEALYYQSLFHKAAVKGMQLGPMSDPGVTGQALTPQGELVWGSPANGVILYQYLRPRQPGPVDDPVNVPKPVPVLPWASGGRQRVPANEHKPLTPSAPEAPGVWDLEYWRQVTGITSTAALIVYLIISEGSRIFPPRNLIPIP
jgi:hypothetical protein